MRDHGGDLDQAIRRHGGPAEAWIDLSTGINRRPYPAPPPSAAALRALPTRAEIAELEREARRAWRVAERDGSETLALAGAQAAIQAIPRLGAPGAARVLAPTYNEYAGALAAAGWTVAEVASIDALEGAELAFLANPNNPDGRRHAPEALRRLAGRVGRLVVDESFADVCPELSLLPGARPPNILTLRSFGKFHGLAGLRLGFVTGAPAEIAALRAMAGPWPVSGPAIAIGRAALADDAWAEATRARLAAEVPRIDALAASAGWSPAGGTALFRLYGTPGAEAARDRLAAHRIWSRVFPWSASWIRLGLPGSEPEWDRLCLALAG
ncbi:threonine-phosphate decarboxylase CobD [Amaricoccus solimangrovi]|uniref:threonine-phosphate decarboxylase n=1 Tax=Amaricoccus solimangrovi TaxID=2589815 RepID=A0A501X016_9RHOB|nr:threonine-phosphate decarboxylase CobD [Amaricoccus solimangrovi]TPE53507.1 threonine-phosphate decarboxylase [Amaricoccus solimangrovi]